MTKEQIKEAWMSRDNFGIGDSHEYVTVDDLLRYIALKDAEIKRLKSLCLRAAKALECFIDYPLPFVEELRKAAE